MRSTLSACLLALLCSNALGADLAAYDPPPGKAVRIIRDNYGVPHVISNDDYSLFYGIGYAQAEDQLENIVKNYLRASGRATEFEGIGSLLMDHLVRILDIPRRGDEQYAALDSRWKSQVDGYAAGVNRFIKEQKGAVPDWIEPVRPEDVLRFSTFVDVIFCVGDCRKDLNQAGIKVAALDRLPPIDGKLYGSNQFAISPGRSGTGNAQLSMDPHLPLNGFYRWYEQHLVGPDVNAMGATFFGVPYVSMGRTQNSAWCMTVNGPDLGDVFAFDIKPDDPTQYRDVDGWKKFDAGEETHQIRMKDKLAEKKIPFRKTSLGPVVAERDGKAYVFALPWPESTNRVRQFYDMAGAKSAAEFKDALRPLGLVMFNLVYADKAGDIFYISNARVPKRDLRIGSGEPRPGHEAWARWQGYHPLDELPQVLNPPCGYVMNTNSGPQNVCLDVAPRMDQFPPYMNSQEANARSRRLSKLLGDDQEITTDETHDYATDTRLEAGDRWRDKLVERLRAAAGSETERAGLAEVADVLAKWDVRTDLDSRGAALFVVIASDKSFADALAAEDDAALVKLVSGKAQRFREKFGALDAPWKDFNRISRGDIDLGIAGCGFVEADKGSFICLRPTYGLSRDGKRYAAGGSSYGMIVDFSNDVRAVSCLPFGVSENPASKHFADQLPLYVDLKFKPAWFEPAEILANAESNRVLEVE
ncbi:MAG: penicillin acylase family protein [Pirellulales bacterium]|nr:penicillin acylase family protein [Pirellulales bacterium]